MGTWRLAISYVRYHKWKAAIVACCLTLTLSIPVCVQIIVDRFHTELMARADSTPLLIGPKGSRFDVVFHSLYFDVPAEPITMAEVTQVRESDLGLAVPLYVVGKAHKIPVVGTTLDYFAIRGLSVSRGAMLGRLGDCVVGAEVAASLDLAPGDRLITDPENPFDLAGNYPLNMRVTGVLDRRQSPDDSAVFVDLKTAWVIQGLGHGHTDLATADGSEILSRESNEVVANAGLRQYTQITDENVASFHFHGEPADFPISAIIFVPNDDKSATLLMGRFVDPNARAQALVPAEVVEELMNLVFRRQRMMNAMSVVLGVVTSAFVALVTSLSLRLRQREMETLFKLGCGRWTIVKLQAVEMLIVLAVSSILTCGMAVLSMIWATEFARSWLT
ncbi:MAG: ABC transporter permease [Planctomycetota bacterium]|nr:ABC transporter permease [Planctomycetota bacterium]